MLTEIKLTNFKCFKEETSIPLSNFNLFTGVNGAGKSTVLQALLLMRQSVEHDTFIKKLILNGNCVNLGSFDDVKNRENSQDKEIVFYFSSTIFDYEKKADEYIEKPFSFSYKFYREENDDMCLRIDSICAESEFFYFDTSFLNTHFISADRIGPQEFYLKSNLPEFINVGTKGEFTVNLLDKLAEQLVNESLCLGNDARTLITQTEAWLGKILNPLKLEVPRSRTNILELFIGDFKPANVGFGYSSILPIIVTGLIAKPDEKIIIENPEIHLHPKAQSALIEFLVKVANTGVQIFIESHSDHILNALRIAVLKQQLKPQQANILYFQTNTVQQIPIEQDGRIEQWPKDFFDQMDNDFNVLFGM
jgi:predicted ATPase